ncbi:MAG: hypothetical protein R3A79_21655 [Nannocystaceae bacterium]
MRDPCAPLQARRASGPGRRGRALVAAALLGLAPSCAHRPRADAPTRAWSYTIDDHGERWDVELCFADAPPRRLVAATAAAEALLDPRDPVTGAALERIDGDAPQIDLAPLRGGCLTYGVDVAAAAGGWSRRLPAVGGDRLVANELWLWHPPRVAEDATITADFRAREGERVSMPWTPRGEAGDGRYTLPEAALRWSSYSAVGRLEVHALEVAGGALEVVVLDAPRRLTPDGLRRWLTAAGEAAAALYGAFPRPRLQLLVVPVDSYGEPVLFGAVERGGDSVFLLINGNASDDAFVGEWVAIHEILHTGMPFVARGDAWLAEGFVTYYTEVVRARTGLKTEAQAWRALLAGFGRGERDVRGDATLGEASAAMGRLHAYSWVYWGGAAIALANDVAIREASAGARSLDDGLRHLSRCCAQGDRRWGAAEILAELDAWRGSALVAPLCQEILATSGFDELAGLYRKLGVSMVDENLGLDDTAPLAPIRRAIFAKTD